MCRCVEVTTVWAGGRRTAACRATARFTLQSASQRQTGTRPRCRPAGTCSTPSPAFIRRGRPSTSKDAASPSPRRPTSPTPTPRTSCRLIVVLVVVGSSRVVSVLGSGADGPELKSQPRSVGTILTLRGRTFYESRPMH